MKFKGDNVADFYEGVVDERGAIKARILSEIEEVADRRDQAVKCQNILLGVCQKIRNYLHVSNSLDEDNTITAERYDELAGNLARGTIEDIIYDIQSGKLESPDLQIK
tara:strand:+ start:245 stop:568 length:324 start_codon:yes stop_codon:yes gene_type:complete